jgi:DNA polymerase
MDLITLDFETYYSKEFSLGKLTTEEYIRDPRFEVIGVGVKLNDQDTEWASGTREELTTYLKTFSWDTSLVIAHNTMFDGAILSWIFDIHPKVYGDTLCMARAYHGVESSGSLKALAERHNIGAKGTEVIEALGKKRADFTAEELARYGDYCINDVDLTFKLFRIMGREFPKKEFKLIDATLRMFVEPILDLDLAMLEQHLMETRDSKDELLTASGVTKEDLMSNPKFAEVLKTLGIEPPMKISLTTGKETFAFAKSDEEFKALETHPDEKVQALVTARLGTKSTLEETRTQRFIDIAKRGLLPVPVKYYAAHTGRWGGDDKINLQNLPSRGVNGKKLKRSIIAPEGYTLIDSDSSQIEARVLAWLANEDDLTRAFADGEDVYVKMASRIYGRAEEDITKDERFVGKTTILGAGYGMGALKFQSQLKTFGFDMSIKEARRVIKIYRETNWKINKLWRDAQQILVSLSNNELPVRLGRGKVLITVPEENAIRLPSGLLMRYEDLDYETGEMGEEFSYQTRRGRTRIYGGKVVENVCQAIARCIIGEQMLKINKEHRAVLTVHDSIVCCVKDEEVTDAQKYIEECMRWTPEWADGLPINCESGTGKTYGDCE